MLQNGTVQVTRINVYCKLGTKNKMRVVSCKWKTKKKKPYTLIFFKVRQILDFHKAKI